MAEIAQWTVFETALESTADYANPFWDVTLQVHSAAPSSNPAGEHRIGKERVIVGMV
jgi:hypothetical protein